MPFSVRVEKEIKVRSLPLYKYLNRHLFQCLLKEFSNYGPRHSSFQFDLSDVYSVFKKFVN